MTSQGLPGFRDFPPPEFALRAHIIDVWRSVAGRYGFEEYDGPPLEPLELYTAKSGEEIVGQLYTFVDKGGREVAMRPEMTPSLARIVTARANGLKKPIRWFSIPQLFRYERQQRGRLREHFQLNCDLIGEAGPLADAEIIALAIDIMRAFGLGPDDVRVKLSDRRVLTALLLGKGVREDAHRAAFQAIDRLERGRRVALAEQLADAGLNKASIDYVFSIAGLRGHAAVVSALEQVPGGKAAGDGLGAVVGAIEAMGLGDWVDVDLSVVRGLAYYTGTVFELFDAKGELRAICGGGRYDTLLHSLGGVDFPALGFGMGDVVLGELLKDRGLHPALKPSVEVFVAGITPDDTPHVLALSHDLREAGFRVEYAFVQDGLTRQLKLAGSRGARLVAITGPDDRARGEVQLKDLERKAQEGVMRDALALRCRELLSRTA